MKIFEGFWLGILIGFLCMCLLEMYFIPFVEIDFNPYPENSLCIVNNTNQTMYIGFPQASYTSKEGIRLNRQGGILVVPDWMVK